MRACLFLTSETLLTSVPEVQPVRSFLLSLGQIVLVLLLGLGTKFIPLLALIVVDPSDRNPRSEEYGETEDADRNKYPVSSMVERGVVFSVDLGTDDRTDLDKDVVGGDLNGTTFHREGVLGDPGGDDRVEVGVCDAKRGAGGEMVS